MGESFRYVRFAEAFFVAVRGSVIPPLFVGHFAAIGAISGVLGLFPTLLCLFGAARATAKTCGHVVAATSLQPLPLVPYYCYQLGVMVGWMLFLVMYQ